MSARVWQFTGVAAAGGVGYYLYNAGGNPKVAEKKFEADASKVLPFGKSKEAKKDTEVLAADVGARLDNAMKDVKKTTSNVDGKLESYRKEAEKTIEQKVSEAEVKGKAAVDSFDKNVTEGAAKAKGSISGWFGGK